MTTQWQAGWTGDPYPSTQDYWTQLGFQGPTTVFNGEESVVNSGGLQDFLNSMGYSRAEAGANGGAARALLDRSGAVVPGSQYFMDYGDDQFGIAAALASLVAGGAAAGAFGGGGAAGAGAAGGAGAGTAGATAGAGGLSDLALAGAYDAGLTGVGSNAALTAGGSLGGGLTAAQVGQGASTASGLLDALKGAGDYVKPIAAIAGAAAGAADAGPQETSSERKLDPRLDAILYGQAGGNGGLLGAIGNYFQQHQGIDPTMQQGLDMQKAFFTSPQYAQGFGQIRDQGLQLLQGGMAGNPFTSGSAALTGNPFLRG